MDFRAFCAQREQRREKQKVGQSEILPCLFSRFVLGNIFSARSRVGITLDEMCAESTNLCNSLAFVCNYF